MFALGEPKKEQRDRRDQTGRGRNGKTRESVLVIGSVRLRRCRIETGQSECSAHQISCRHQIGQEINFRWLFVHQSGRRAMIVDPPETWSPVFTRTSASSGKYNSVREPKRIIPKRSPFFNSSPTFDQATMRLAIAPVSCLTTIVLRKFSNAHVIASFFSGQRASRASRQRPS